jgi:two-component system, NtrC family, nitrogen regulation response regulator NtrX
MARKILVVDDEASILESLSGILSDEGFTPICASNGEQGLRIIEEEAVDIVLLDIWMPGLDGLEVLKRIREMNENLPVIMISGHGTIETAVQATKMGAFDFIEKPPSYEKIMVAINNALRLSQLAEENRILRQKNARKPQLTGVSPAVRQLRGQIERVAPTAAWVLIRGEHGTGKELVAQAIHGLSPASHKPMIELNCAAIPEELIESELFGHERGAFTGATAPRRGKFDLADGGLLFLDEIADMSLKTQAKILRILQEQKFERVGGVKTISVNVRVLTATNKNLEEEIKEGRFRADLFYRLNVVPLRVPPLRERLEDLPLLVEDFSEEFARKGLGGKRFSLEALMVMASHNWPGNIRELRNFVERMVIMSPEPVISGSFARQLLQPLASSGPEAGYPGETGFYEGLSFKEAKKAFERDFIQARLQENSGNISQTAEQIGLERSHLHKKVKSLADEED